MTFNKIEVLLFDLGGVLIENTSFIRLGQLQPKWKNCPEMKSRWLASAAIRMFETGQIEAQEFAQRFIAEWDLSISIDAFLADFANWPTAFFPGALQMLSELRPHYRLACLSNSNAVHWEKFGGFAGIFDLTLSSHLLRLIKPDSAVFIEALRLCGTDARSVAFFDDSPDNVSAATAIGMRAFHVEGLHELQSVLQDLKCLPACKSVVNFARDE
jgi:HAD superfamily hydrolase (TIGR01509 family)